MPTISAKIIKKAKDKTCDGCRKKIKAGDRLVRLYGSAFRCDPKYIMYLCMDCAEKSGDEKTRSVALAKERIVKHPITGTIHTLL